MEQAQGSALLRPMRPDSLLRISGTPAPSPVAPAKAPLMHRPTFAPWPAASRRPVASALDALWEDVSWLDSEEMPDPDEADEDGEDAVPTERMAMPVAVPLDEPCCPRSHGRAGWLCLGAAVLAAAGWALWRLELLF